MKKTYIEPSIKVHNIMAQNILTGSTENISVSSNGGDGSDALAKKNNLWGDDDE